MALVSGTVQSMIAFIEKYGQHGTTQVEEDQPIHSSQSNAAVVLWDMILGRWLHVVE